MKRLVLILMLVLMPSVVMASAPDRRICDNDGDCLLINSDGTLPITGGGGASASDDLTDVNTATAAAGQILVNDGTQWNALAVGSNDQLLTADSAVVGGVKWAGGGSGATQLTGLADVNSSTATRGNILVGDGSAFISTSQFSVDPGTGNLTIAGTIEQTGATSTITASGGAVLYGDVADTIELGQDSDGHDFVLYGDTASANATWDSSADALLFNGSAQINASVTAVTNDINSATASIGSLFVADGSTFGALPIGSNGQFLKVDTSSAPFNVTWAAGGGGSSQLSDLADINSATQGRGRLLASDGTSFHSIAGGDGTGIFPYAGQGYENLVITNSTTTATITADRLVLRNVAGSPFLVGSVNVTANITVSGAGGLDTGVEGSSTWYAVWVIAKEDGTKAGLLSLSSTSPTMPATYVYRKRVGWMRNDASSNFREMYQANNVVDVINEQTRVINDGSATVFTDVDCSSYAAPTARIVKGTIPSNAGQVSFFVSGRPNGSSSTNGKMMLNIDGGTSIGMQATTYIIATDSSQIWEYKNSASSKATDILCDGYFDNL